MAIRPISLISEGLYPQHHKPQRELIHLAMGILTQAVRDLISPQKKVEKDWRLWRDDSQEWFDSDEVYPGSFLWVCDIIGADPEKMRRWVRSLHRLDRKQRKAVILSLIRLTYLRDTTEPPAGADEPWRKTPGS
ncbi:MAG: hypothetical protein Kow00109_02930 [Acidobacteriota bacterium]